ncbi:hypothetical protein [uncultured Fibrobacter sp.]|uniref:hypothetical protein n=1 Tax=uncultured Fibrobacter sp. TaxID=261512 RepID=UPI0028064C70|nr:hypothetical protein [uncultured Fibrobacter sp.]
MSLFDLIKKNGSGDNSVAESLFNSEYRKNVFRTEDQRMAAFYFSIENIGKKKGCFGGKKSDSGEKKGCFGGKMPKVETRPYFDDDKKGCFKKSLHHLSDADYDALVNKILTKENFEQKALDALLLDESEVTEIKPIHFNGYLYYVIDESSGERKKTKWKMGADFLIRTSAIQETWIFFTPKALLVYQCRFNLDGNSKTEMTYEYQFKDITSVKVVESDTEEIDSEGQRIKKHCSFEIHVPGDSIECAFNVNDDQQVDSVKAMKTYIREKKNA